MSNILPLRPKVVPGCCGSHSATGCPTLLSEGSDFPRQSASYGSQGLLACSSAMSGGAEIIFIFDMNSLLLVQSLVGHKSAVTTLLWRLPRSSTLQSSVHLWSGDASGTLIYWDVTEGIALTSLRIPCGSPLQSLSLLADNYLLAITTSSKSYFYHAHLADCIPLSVAALPLDVSQSSLMDLPTYPSAIEFSTLSDQNCCVVLLGDRLRVIQRIDLQSTAPPASHDLIYESTDGAATVIDAFFSRSQEGVLYFATRNTIGSYDWQLDIVLNEQLLWMSDAAEFRKLYPSNATTASYFSDVRIPLLYSLGSDQRLTAWYLTRQDKFTTVSTDVRGTRMNAKMLLHVVQCQCDSTLFAVLFEDGGVAQWRLCLKSQRWKLLRCWSAPMTRPRTFCAVGVHHCCVALESGCVALVDITHNMAVRRLNLIYSGGTQVACLVAHQWEDVVWVVSDRVVQGRHHHQVSLLDTRTGEVSRVLRKPPAVPESTRVKEATMDPGYHYLLLAFLDGTFEVWNTKEGTLVHMNSNTAVRNVSWAPQAMQRCLRGIQGDPQLLAVFFSDGTISLWSVYKDRVVVSRDALPVFGADAMEGMVRSIPVGEALVVYDSSGNGAVLSPQGTRLTVRRLRDAPLNCGAVLCLSSPISPSSTFPTNGDLRRETSSSSSPFSAPNQQWSFANAEASLLSPLEEPASPSHVRQLTAVLFENGIFALWDLSTGERCAISTSGATSSIRAVSLYWKGESLCVLATDGCIYVMDASLSELNGSVRSRALRRPLKNMSFLLPSHRAYLQTALELGVWLPPVRAADGSLEVSTSLTVARESSGTLLDAAPLTARPCRGPFGQLLTENMDSLQDELTIYCYTMVPRDVEKQFAAQRVLKCSPTAALLKRSLLVAYFFGQELKQRCILLLLQAMGRWLAAESPAAALVSPGSPTALPWHTMKMTELEPTSSVPRPYLLSDAFSEAFTAMWVMRRNRLLLNEQRSAALLLNTRTFPQKDDSVARRFLAMEFVKLQQFSHAVDVLLDTSTQSEQFNELSTLGMTIAAATAAGAATGGDAASSEAEEQKSQTLFTTAAKRVSAMLLAKGDVDGAVEKLLVAGNYDEACLTLQSKDRWRDAVVVAKLLPPAYRSVQEEAVHRWASVLACHNHRLLAVSLLLSFPAPPAHVLALLVDCAQYTDLAGIMAVALAPHYLSLPASTQTKEAWPALLSRQKDGSSSTAGVEAASPPALDDALLHILADYCSLLHTLGNIAGEHGVLQHVAALKASMRSREVGNPGVDVL